MSTCQSQKSLSQVRHYEAGEQVALDVQIKPRVHPSCSVLPSVKGSRGLRFAMVFDGTLLVQHRLRSMIASA